MTSTEDFLFGGGGQSAKFDTIGETITGTIVSTEVKQQTDIKDGTPLTWDNGDPRMQLVVVLQTDLKDDEDDNGQRAVYVKGSKKSGTKSLHDAVAQAVREAGAKGIEPGGNLTITFTGTEPSATRGFNDRKLYSATYEAPDKAAQTGGFLGTESTTEVKAPTPEQLAAIKAAGLNPEDVFGQRTG